VPWKILIPLAFPILIVSFFVLFYIAKPHSKKVTVVAADFVNNTGDPTFDHSLEPALEQDLEDATFPHILSESEMKEALLLMKEQPSQPVGEELARRICLQTGSKAVVVGSISKFSDGYVVSLKSSGCSTRDIVADTQTQAARKEDVPQALRIAALQLRAKFMDSR
jgi:hypothetical protein